MKAGFNIIRVFAALAAVFSVVYLFVTYGTALLASPFSSVSFDGPVAAASNEEFTAIVDTESRRVLIVNADERLTGVINCDTADSPIEAITDVCVSDNYIYVSGVKYHPDSDGIDKERVVIYDKGGNLLGTMYDEKHESDGSGSLGILNISDTAEGVVVAIDEATYDESSFVASDSVTFYSVSQDSPDAKELASLSDITSGVREAGYSGESGHYVMLSTRGLIYSDTNLASHLFDDHVFTAVDIDDEGRIYACDDTTGALCRVEGDETVDMLIEGDGFDSVHVSAGRLSICNRESNRVIVSDLDGSALLDATSVMPSIGFTVRMLLVWVCAAYLIALAAVLAVKKLRASIALGRTDAIGPLLASVAIMAVAVVAVGSLSYATYQTSINTRTNEVGMCADYLAFADSNISDVVEKCPSREDIRSDSESMDDNLRYLVEMAQGPLGMTYAANKNDIGLYFCLYGKDDKGVFYLTDSANEHILGTSTHSATDGSPLAKAFAGDDLGEDIMSGRTLRDTTMYRLVTIRGADGDVVGVVEIGWKQRSFESLLQVGVMQRALGLLVMMLVVFLAYIELRECGRCLFASSRMQQDHAGDAIALLTRPFTFSITILEGIDAVMTVLIARDLLMASGLDGSNPLLALPTAMLGIGLFAGQLLYGALGSRVGVRRLMACGAVAVMACACFTIASVVFGGFWLYCVAKLVMSVPFGLLYALGYSLPRKADDLEARSAAAGDVKRTDTSAAALGTVLGGYAAQGLGNAWVYALVALACLPIIVMALSFLPKGTPPLENAETGPKERQGVLRFLRSRVAVCIVLFVVFPATIAGGYASFLFPLFSVDLGLTKSDINNIFVLGQLIVFMCISRIDAVEARFGKWRVTTCAIALIGVVFLLFSLNTTIVWSVAVVALVAVLGKSSDGWKALWLRSADDAGVPPARATGTMFAFRSLTQIAQPFILGALLAATDSVAVIVIGALCSVCAGAFFLATRRTALPDEG